MMRTIIALTLTMGLLHNANSRGEDWPEFRGPTGQGISRAAGLPTAWGPAKNVAWKQQIPGTGWSSPVVVNGRIYLTSSVPIPGGGGSGDQSLRAFCLDAKTGKILWEQEAIRQDGSRAPRIHGKNSHASPTPIVDGQRLYVHFGHQGTACLDLAGKVLWRNTSLTYAPVHGNGGSPILAGKALIYSADGGDQRFVVALDRGTGAVLWKTPREGETDRMFSFSTPMLIEVDGKKQVISPGSDVVCAYDPENGHEIWRVRYQGYSVIPRPVFGHGLVFVCTGFNSPSLLAIRPDGHGDVTDSHVAWTTSKAAPHTPSLLLNGDELYMVSDNGTASCLDARTGKVHWQERLGGKYSASPLLAQGKIYFQSEEGTGTIVEASKQFKQVAKNSLNERSQASPVPVDGGLLIRTENNLYCFKAR
jgi:outer membrane protein assembly factor BamB